MHWAKNFIWLTPTVLTVSKSPWLGSIRLITKSNVLQNKSFHQQLLEAWTLRCANRDSHWIHTSRPNKIWNKPKWFQRNLHRTLMVIHMNSNTRPSKAKLEAPDARKKWNCLHAVFLANRNGTKSAVKFLLTEICMPHQVETSVGPAQGCKIH